MNLKPTPLNHWLPLLCPQSAAAAPPPPAVPDVPPKRTTKCKAVLVTAPNGAQQRYESISAASADIKMMSRTTIARSAHSGKPIKHGTGNGYRAEFVE